MLEYTITKFGSGITITDSLGRTRYFPSLNIINNSDDISAEGGPIFEFRSGNSVLRFSNSEIISVAGVSTSGMLIGLFDQITSLMMSSDNNLKSANETALATTLSYNTAVRNNPHYNSVISSPPNLNSTGGSAAPGLTNFYYAVSFGSPSASFSYYGGSPVIFANDYLQFPSTTVPSGGNISNKSNAVTWRVGFYSDSPKVAIGVLGYYKYRFLVDNSYVSKEQTDYSVFGGAQYTTLDFTAAGGSKKRYIEVEGFQAGGFHAVAVQPNYKVWSLAITKKLIIVGDSFVVGTGTSIDNDGLGTVIADYLGIRNVVCVAIGGTGYTNAGTTYKFADHSSDWTTKNPDIIVFAGGINDADDNNLQPAVQSLVQNTRAALPNTIIVVLGVWPGSTGPSNATISKEKKIAAAVSAIADKYIVFIPIATDPTGSWVTGNGKIDAPTGDGNSDIVTCPDGTHPTNYGHLYLGQRIADKIAEQLYFLLIISSS